MKSKNLIKIQQQVVTSKEKKMMKNDPNLFLMSSYLNYEFEDNPLISFHF